MIANDKRHFAAIAELTAPLDAERRAVQFTDRTDKPEPGHAERLA